jgi:hypothetical protein
MVLTASFVLSLVIGLSCHHRQRNAKHCRQLDASVEAPRPHDFTVHGIATRQLALPCPSHPASNVRDDRDTPLLSGAGRGELLKVICPTAQGKSWVAPHRPLRPRKRKSDRTWPMSGLGHNRALGRIYRCIRPSQFPRIRSLYRSG